MSRHRKTLDAVLRGTSDANIAFRDLLALVRALGFDGHVRGDHHIFYREGIPDIINLQPKGSKAKPYQVKQVRDIILRERLGASL